MYSLKNIEQIGIGMAYLHVFLITMHDKAAEVYLEPFQIYMIELFAKIVNGLRKKAPS